MGGLTWRQLGAPEYLMTFLEGFLLGFTPAVGLGHAASGNGAAVADLAAHVPNATVLIGGMLLGLLNGIRSLRNLRAPVPETRTTDPAKS